VAGDLGAGASGTGLNAAFGRRQEAITSTSVWAIRQAFEVCVVSGGRGLLEAAASVTVAFDLDVPFWQDAEEAQRVDQSTATWGDAAVLVGVLAIMVVLLYLQSLTSGFQLVQIQLSPLQSKDE